MSNLEPAVHRGHSIWGKVEAELGQVLSAVRVAQDMDQEVPSIVLEPVLVYTMLNCELLKDEHQPTMQS